MLKSKQAMIQIVANEIENLTYIGVQSLGSLGEAPFRRT